MPLPGEVVSRRPSPPGPAIYPSLLYSSGPTRPLTGREQPPPAAVNGSVQIEPAPRFEVDPRPQRPAVAVAVQPARRYRALEGGPAVGSRAAVAHLEVDAAHLAHVGTAD